MIRVSMINNGAVLDCFKTMTMVQAQKRLATKLLDREWPLTDGDSIRIEKVEADAPL